MKPRLRTWILIQRIKRLMWSYLNSSILNTSQGYTQNKSKCMKEKKKGKTTQTTLIPSVIESECYFRVYDLKWEWTDIKSLIAFLKCPPFFPFHVPGLQGKIKALQVPWKYLLPLMHDFNFDLPEFKKSVQSWLQQLCKKMHKFWAQMTHFYVWFVI